MDVVVREVVREDRRGRLADLEVDERGRSRAGVRSTSSRDASGPPGVHTRTPFIQTSTSYGSNSASVVPIAASTRPQFGSLPKIAALKRLLRATERPTSTASDSDAACTTAIVMSWLAPSASPCSCRARSGQTSASAAAKSSGSGVDAGRAARHERHLVVRRHAAVGVEPVEGDPRGAAQRGVGLRGVEHGVGGDHHEHRREARAPASRRPSPCRRSTSRRCETTERFGLESVVMMARDAASPPSALSSAMPCSVPSSTFARNTSSPVPMRPVEQIRTSPALTPSSSAAFSAVWCVVWNPKEPGEAVRSAGVEHDRLDDAVLDDLLRPDDRVGLRAVGREDRGADLERAAVHHDGDVGLAARLESDGDAGRLESLCCGDAHGATPFTVSAVPSGRPSAMFMDWIGGAGGALDEVVDRRDHDDPVRGAVDREADEGGVGAQDVGGARELARGQQLHEGLVAVGGLPGAADLGIRRAVRRSARCTSRGCRAPSARGRG